MWFSFQHAPRRTNCSHLCQTQALFRNNIGCVLFIGEIKAVLTDTVEETSPQFFLSNQSSWCSILYFILQTSRLFGTYGRSVIICGFSFYLCTRPCVLMLELLLGTVACMAETVGLPIFWVIFLSQAALPPYVCSHCCNQTVKSGTINTWAKSPSQCARK